MYVLCHFLVGPMPVPKAAWYQSNEESARQAAERLRFAAHPGRAISSYGATHDLEREDVNLVQHDAHVIGRASAQRIPSTANTSVHDDSSGHSSGSLEEHWSTPPITPLGGNAAAPPLLPIILDSASTETGGVTVVHGFAAQGVLGPTTSPGGEECV